VSVRAAILAGALIVGGCAIAPPEPGAPAFRYDPDWYARAPAGRVYRIDASASELVVHVRRAGWLGFLGHHHLLENRALRGYLWVSRDRAAARADVRVEAAGFVVDPAERARPPELGPQPGPDAIAATAANLSGPRVLDVERYPALTGQARLLRWTAPDTGSFQLALAVKDAVWDGVVEARIVEAAGRGEVGLELTLDQSALGLTPIDVFWGAVSVADRLTVRLSLVATAVP
jgi:hypothetical protein